MQIYLGMPLTAGLVTRKNCRSSFNAQTVQLMKAAGAIPFVTTNVSELGMWYESYNRVYGRTRNPYDSNRTSGGSSGKLVTCLCFRCLFVV